MLSQLNPPPEINLRLQQVSQRVLLRTTQEPHPRGHRPQAFLPFLTATSGSVPVVVFQHPTEPRPATNRRLLVSDEFFGSYQNVADSLVIPLSVVMPQEFLQRPLQAADAKASHLSQALTFDAAHPALSEGVQVRVKYPATFLLFFPPQQLQPSKGLKLQELSISHDWRWCLLMKRYRRPRRRHV